MAAKSKMQIVCTMKDSDGTITDYGVRIDGEVDVTPIPKQLAVDLCHQGHEFFVNYGGREVRAEASEATPPYLRTYPDGIKEDNLDNLKSCAHTSTGRSIDDFLKDRGIRRVPDTARG